MLNKRQQSILAFITENGEAKNSQLQALIGDCSSMTLWRDLEKLEQEGKIVRFRGGAQAAPEQEDGQGQETNFVRRARLNTGEKESIALISPIFSTRGARPLRSLNTFITAIITL